MSFKKVTKAEKETPKTVKHGVIILDNNPLSIASFLEEHPEAKL